MDPQRTIRREQRAWPTAAFTVAACAGLILAACGDGHLTGPVPLGNWGGNGILLSIGPNNAIVEFDCATGVIEGPIHARNGRFDMPGTYRAEPAIPTEDPPVTQSVRYLGDIRDNVMQLRVRVSETQVLGPWEVHRGQAANRQPCSS